MSISVQFHSMMAIRGRRFRCTRCRLETDLGEAVRHVVENQLDMTRWVERALGPS